MYFQLNVVTGAASVPHVVLIRAVEPEEGIERMRLLHPGKKDRELTRGPESSAWRSALIAR